MMGSLVPNAGLRRGLTLRVEPWPGEAKPDLVAVCLGNDGQLYIYVCTFLFIFIFISMFIIMCLHIYIFIVSCIYLFI